MSDPVRVLGDADFALLNALYLRKMADEPTLFACAGSAAAGADLGVLAGEGLAEHVGGQYLITDEGRRAVLEYYDRTYGPLRSDGDLEQWYQRFEDQRNGSFLAAVSEWQSSGDARGLDQIGRLVERQIRALRVCTSWIPRYSAYVERFTRAADHLDAGDTRWIASPTVDSVHNIWFEFHEDILAVLGRPRETVES